MPCITNYVKFLLHSQENLLKDYQRGPWFEGFTFVKTALRKPDRNCQKLPRTSQQHVLVLSARHGELVASWWRVDHVFCGLARHGDY
jgi:hypothetical protein